MPRFGFKSSSSGSNNGIPLNSPKVASSSRSKGGFSSRDEPTEKSRKDKDSKSKKSSSSSRRRNFGFLKTGVGRTEKSSDDKSAISKRREHAKQLANLAYSDDPTTSISTTATSTSTNDSQFAYNMNANVMSPVNNNNNRNDSNTSFFAQQQPSSAEQQSGSSNSKRRTTSRPRTNSNKSATSSNSNTSNSSVNDAFGSDPFASFDAFGTSSSSHGALSANEFSELDFFAAQLAGATTPVYQSKQKQHQQEQQQSSSSKKDRGRKSQPISLDHFFTDDDASSFSSNHTGNDLNTIDNDGGSISKNAAARRRMRSHMHTKHSSSNNDMGSISSVGSGASSSLAHSRSTPQMPSGSPGMLPSSKSRFASQKNGKTSSWGSSSNNISDHHQSPFRSTGSATSSTANYSSSSPGVNLFDSDTENGNGFTFDAFGLDESQVEREVNSAMKDIFGNGGFSIFDDENGSGSNRSGSESGQGSGNNSVGSGSNAGAGKNSFFRQDSFGGNQTDASETSFEAQNWDSSPNTSRAPSPVPLPFSSKSSRSNRRDHADANNYHLNKEGFVDGFGDSPVTPQKPPVQLSSAQQRRLQRRAQRGGTTAIAMTPQGEKNDNSNISSLRQISSEPPAKTKTASDFAAFDSPWQEDPFASSDDGGRISDLFANESREASTARRLYSETQSDVQDYYPSGGMTAAANSLLDATTPKQMTPSNRSTGSNSSNYARSDIGVSGRFFASPASTRAQEAPAFFELPPAEEIGNQSESDQSDDMDQMQDDLAHEFAKDIVRRISPSGGSQASSHRSSSGKKSVGESVRSFRSHPSTASNREDVTGGRRIQYGDDRIDESESDDQVVRDSNPQHSDYHASQQYPSQSVNNNRETTKTAQSTNNRFGSFRSRYEKSRSSSAISEAPTPTASNTKSDLGSNSYHGSLRSSYDASKSNSNSSQPLAQDVDPPIEEKKEEERSVHHRTADPTPPPRKINSLRARWEAKTRVPVEKPSPRAPPKPSERSEHTKKNINSMDNSFEMLTPDIMEQRRQSRNKDKFNNLRKSMGVIEEANVRGDSKSDVGSSPSYLSNARLRNVASPVAPVHETSADDSTLSNRESTEQTFSPAASPVGRKMTYRERREMELRAQQQEEEKAAKPVEKKMNYRERREMELKLQREREEKTKIKSPSQNNPKKDVASLIRKRISANKKTKSPPQDSHESSSNSSPSMREPLNAGQKEEAHYSQNHATNSHEASHHESERFGSPSGERSFSNHSHQASHHESERFRSPSGERSFSNRSHQASHHESERFGSPSGEQSFSNRSHQVSHHESERFGSPSGEQSFSNRSHQASHHESERFRSPSGEQSFSNRSHQASHHESERFRPPSGEQSFSNRSVVANGLTNSTGAIIHKNEETQSNGMKSPRKNQAQMLENLFAARAPPMVKQPSPEKPASSARPPHQMLENFLSAKTQPKQVGRPIPFKPDVSQKVAVPEDVSKADATSMLSGFLAKRAPSALPLPANEGEADSLKKHHSRSPSNSPSKDEDEVTYSRSGGIPALKDDPKFERYFRMLKMGLPLDVAKHAMVRDGLDPSVLDMDRNKPFGVPMKDDPTFTKYFKMLKIGISMDQVKHSMVRDGLNGALMDQDHNIPVFTVEKKKAKKKKETHRRARLHWKTIKQVVKNSLWDTVQSEIGAFSIDEEEFSDLFQADLKSSNVLKTTTTSKKKGAAIRVIDSKRANNGGIILARVKLTHDQMADTVDRIDASTLTAEQIENVLEYLPTKDERDALEKYMLEGGQDAAEKFDGLCECEKFMVSMMTVKHAKRKIRALLFKLQFMTCMESIANDAKMIDTACDELINSNRLRQLLGIILQFGNRLNTAGDRDNTKAGGFSLESLSKLSQAKAFDKKTTFLHYIILIVERNNEILLKYYDDIPTVLEAHNIFWDQCQQDLEEVENQLENVRRISLYEARANNGSVVTGISDDDSLGEMDLSLEEEVVSLRATPTGLFTLGAIKQVSALREKIERTKTKCLRLKQYFGVTSKNTEPQEIFSVFGKFTRDFQKAKEQVFSTAHKRLREDRKKARQNTPKKQKPREPLMRASSHQPNMNNLFGDIQQQRQPSNSSSRQDSQNEVQSSRAGLLSSIKERQSPSERSAPSSRAGLFDAIKQRNPPSENSAPSSGRAGLLDAIKQRPSESSAPSSRGGFMDAIKQRQPSSESSAPSSRAGILDAIKQRPQPTPSENANDAAPSNGNHSAAFVTQRQPRPIETQTSPPSSVNKPSASRTPRDAMRHRRLQTIRAQHGN
jgi:hypothetical protein